MSRQDLFRRLGGSESGSASVVAAGLLCLVLVLVLVSVDLLRSLHARAQAQTAADAAALAAAQDIALFTGREPGEAAAEFARRNGGSLLVCRCAAGTGEAIVEVEMPVRLLFLGPGRVVRAWARAVVEGTAQEGSK